VWSAAVGNPKAPVEVIAAGARDRSPYVRRAAASNPRISEEAADRLSRSKAPAIHRALAENPAVPERIRVVAAMRAGVAF
jgi:hypothetical protein